MKKKKRVVRKKQPQSIISDEITIPNHSGMLDAGEVHRTPTDDLDPVNKKYVDDEIGSDHPHQDVQTTASPSFQGVTLPVTTASNIGVIYKAANRFMHDYKASGSSGENTFIGTNAGNFTMAISGQVYHASYNTGIGYNVLSGLTYGYHNMGLGNDALKNNSSGSSNMGIGVNALKNNTTGDSNTAVGRSALENKTAGSNNTAIGREAGRGVASSTINYNTLIGYSAGYALNTGGDRNLLIGYRAGDNITTGERNILIGYLLDAQSTTGDSKLSIGNLIFGTGGFGSGTAIGAGNIGIKKRDPACALDVDGAIASAVKTITASTDALDVAGVNTVFINPAAAVVIGGFANGVTGQRVDVVVVDADQNVTMEDMEATGTQKLRLHQSADETLASERGGWTFVFDGTYWYDVSHARHV